MVMWGLAGMIGVIILVGFVFAGYRIIKNWSNKKMGDLEESKYGARTPTIQEDKLKCELGNSYNISRIHNK